ncbi:inorganic phosphate transporter [Rhizobium sp. AAP43]|uniref:inorganic phosphate transporter n=1 Tax=Rhizobium sp. AAP43 TaxID=1523420 RepID=UPI0006B9AEB5|nr:inorganic phosphate transporter [Rhizobium sp. AAP43]KPF43667.1 inorganic phosphate transporter [Rhizobium sp. AAP43]
MGKSTPKLLKPTLDKDLDKITQVEEASQHVWRGVAPFGLALIFLILAAVVAAGAAMDRSGATIVVAAATVAAYMAMNIGANDVTNNVGPAVGARVIRMGTALAMAVVFEIAGAMIAGDKVVSTISEGILSPGMAPSRDVFIWAMMAALLSAGVWVNFATWINAPVSTTHSIVGGVLGAGVAAVGASALNWGMVAAITASWVISPLLGGVIAALVLAFVKEFIIYREDKIAAARRWVPVLIAIMTGTFISYLALEGFSQFLSIGVATAIGVGLVCGFLAWLLVKPLVWRQAAGLENRNQSLRKLFRLPLIFAAALLSFAHGANDVANAIGPLTAIVEATRPDGMTGSGTPQLWVLLIGAFGISVGILLFGPRLIRIVGEEITKLNPMRAFCVSLSTATTVILASALGLPVSSTHIAVGAVFGVGFFREWYTRHSKRRVEYMRAKAERFEAEPKPERNPEELRRRYLVRRSHFMTIVAAWVITVPTSAALAAVLYLVMSHLVP